MSKVNMKKFPIFINHVIGRVSVPDTHHISHQAVARHTPSKVFKRDLELQASVVRLQISQHVIVIVNGQSAPIVHIDLLDRVRVLHELDEADLVLS